MYGNRYTIIDLGSNSFHMLTVEKTDNGFSVLSKHKRKVRLASGLDEQHNLNRSTMESGWSCLQHFKEQLAQIQPHKILISATAALRLAKNKQLFINRAEQILAQPIRLLSGIEEAETIYRGVAFTDNINQQLLVIDIGGASTELVIGKGSQVLLARSLNMGCVTWLNNHFSDNKLNHSNFERAIEMAKTLALPELEKYHQQGWNLTMGASGTIQALQEINHVQQIDSEITLSLLNNIKQQCIVCQDINSLKIDGLKASRVPVFASGLAILIALFETLNINSLKRSNGALREGLISILFNEN